MATRYCSPKDVLNYLNWLKEVPEFIEGSTPTLETVDDTGTLSSGSVIYLDNRYITSASLILYKGSSPTNVVTLSENVDYTINLDKAKITLTSAGATNVGTSSLYAEYTYNKFLSETVLGDYIDKNTALIDEKCNQSFQPSTSVTEYQYGKGFYDRQYRVKRLPLINVTSVFVSNTAMGSTPVYTELTAGSEYTYDTITGTVHLQMSSITPEGVTRWDFPLPYPDRFKVIYNSGISSVPPEISKLCVLMTCRDVLNSAIAKGLAEGVDGFSPRADEVLTKEIDRLFKEFTLLLTL